MAAFKGVYYYSACTFIVCLLFLTNIGEGIDSRCSQQWHIFLTKDLALSWTGDDRDAIVTATFTTNDTYGQECDSDKSLKSKFSDRSIKINKTCSNAFYLVSVELKCGTVFQNQDQTIRTPPDAPTITSVKPTNSSIEVKWSPPPGKIHLYKVTLRGGRKLIETKEQKTDNTTCNFENLLPYTNYQVTVAAKNENDWGKTSPVESVQTLEGVPSAPRNLRRYSSSDTGIQVTWDDPSPANGVIKGYKVAWGANVGNFTEEYISVNQFNASDLDPFTYYHFKVAGTTEAGWGNWTRIFSTMTDVGVPSKPLNLTVSKVTNTSIVIQWLPPEHKNGPRLRYVIRWTRLIDRTENFDNDSERSNDNSDFEFFYDVEVVKTVYELKNLWAYTRYAMKVSAKSSSGMGNFTEPLTVRTIAGIPGRPDAVIIVNVKPTEISLRWISPSYTNGPLKHYTLHWGVTGTEGSYFNTTLTSYRALGLRPYTRYFFKIAAQAKGGRGDFAWIYSRTSISTPSVARNLLATSVTDHCILLQWSIPENPNAKHVQYTIQWNKFSLESTRQFYKTNSTSYRIRNLASNTKYSIRVRSSTSAGEGPWTESLDISTQPKDHSSAVIVGSVVSGLLVLFIIICIILLYIYKRNGGLRRKAETGPTTISSETLQTTSVSLEVLNDSGKINVGDFDQHVLSLMSNGYYKLAQEFEKLGKESPAFSTDEAKKSDNLTKNRWVKILPFDYSRVKLLPVGDEVEPDFINASYIPGDSCLLEYIATQGPLPNTVNDFWRMVWQESVFLIIMLTQCVERAKRTCENYWPAAGTSEKYGNIDVQTISENISPTFTQRLFLVTQDNKQRHIVHLNYMNWPVSGCPKNPDDFLAFVQAVRSQMSCGVTGPTLVHCSAGIGRTGTYIAVDRLAQQLNRESDEVDVYGTVLEMRRYRANLVQTEEQYYFIHLCLQRIIQEKRQNTGDDYGGGIYSN